MKQHNVLFAIGGFILGATLLWVFTSSSVNQNYTGKIDTNELDAHFIEQMVPHHEDAITMATLAQSKAKRPEVQQLANQIIEAQEKEIGMMKRWYGEWYGTPLPSGYYVMEQHGMMDRGSMHMGMMGSVTDRTNLEQAEDFDTAFVEEMIPHHQMAVMMASMLKNGTNRPEMRQLADDIIEAQTNEINQMRRWLQNW